VWAIQGPLDFGVYVTDEKVPVSATWQIINRDTGEPVEMIDVK
jgi:hypothetical protein